MRNIFEKIEAVKKLVSSQYGSLDSEELLDLVRVCARFHYKKQASLSKNQAKMYELLINNNYNPDTVYKWLLLTKSHPELKSKLKVRAISQRKAFIEKNNVETVESYSEQDLLRDIIHCVERYIIR